MEKELIPINFNLSIRAGDTSNQISLNPDSAGQDITFTILSYREKLINGKRTGEFSYVSDIEEPNLTSRDWIHINYEKQVTYMGYPALEISMKIDKNDSGSSRNTSLVYTQNPSGKIVTVDIQQADNGPSFVELKYFAIGDPGSGYGHYTYDPILEEYNVYLKSTSSKISFKKCFAYIYSDNTFNVTEQSFIDTFEVTNENPINDGFHLGDSQGESTLMVSTKGGNSGTHYGFFGIRWSSGSLIKSNNINLYQE